MPRRYYSSTAVATTLSGNINNSTTSITVTALSGYPTQFPYTAIIDPDTASEEVVTVTAASGTTLTVTRGSDGTSAVSHNAGAVFRHGVSARDFDEANAFANGGGVSNSLVQNTKGAVPVGTGSTVAALSPGSNGQTLVADSSQTNGLRYVNGMIGRNAVINGNFSVWQRGTSFDGTAYRYTADRWLTARSAFAAGGTFSRQTTSDTTNLPNIRHCLRAARDSGNTGTGTLIMIYAFETADSIPFAGQTVTMSFYARKGANYSPSSSDMSTILYTGTGTDESPGIVAGWAGVSSSTATHTLTTTWQRFTHTRTLPTNTTQIGIYMVTGAFSGTAGAADHIEVTGVQLEASPVATPFEFEPYEATLRKCQRYYWRANVPDGYMIGVGQANTATTCYMAPLPYPQPMRATPTASVSGASHFKVLNAGATVFLTSSVATPVGEPHGISFSTLTVGTGLTAGHATMIYSNNANCFLEVSAEL